MKKLLLTYIFLCTCHFIFGQDEETTASKINLIPKIGTSLLIDKNYEEQPTNFLSSYQKTNVALDLGLEHYITSRFGISLELGSIADLSGSSKTTNSFIQSIENHHTNNYYIKGFNRAETTNYFFNVSVAPIYRHPINKLEFIGKMGVGITTFAQNSEAYLLKEKGSNNYDSVVVSGKKDIVAFQVSPQVGINYRLGRRVLLGLHAKYILAFSERKYNYTAINIINYNETDTNMVTNRPIQFFNAYLGLTIEMGKVKK